MNSDDLLNNKLARTILTVLGLSTIAGASLTVIVVTALIWLLKCAIIVFCGLLFLRFVGLLKIVL